MNLIPIVVLMIIGLFPLIFTTIILLMLLYTTDHSSMLFH
jgi:hypothetical protein